MFEYNRKIHYYETDMMGITHHANYVRLMEETRIAYLEALSYSYKRLESEGIISPVTGLTCKYHTPTTFGDAVSMRLRIASFNGVILTIAYELRKEDGTLAFSATSEHCFLNDKGRFVRLKRDYPEFYELLLSQVEPEEAKASS